MKPTFIQQDPSIERRRRLAEHMMANRKTGPVRTGMEGAARIAEQLVAGYQLGKARKDQAAWDEAARKDLARIMSDYQNDVRPLSQHPGTADIATQIQLSQMEADKAAEAAKAARKTDLEDYIFKKQVDQQYAAPKDRRIAKGPDGVSRYVDTGEPVFPNVKGVDSKPSKTAFKNEKDLREEFNTITKDFREQQEAFGRVKASAVDPSPAGDLALIFNYMKILDPGSVVRESEFATAAASGSYGERLKAAGQKILTGERLSPQMRADFVRRSVGLYEEAAKGYDARRGQYQALSKRYDANPENVVTSARMYNPDSYAELINSELEAGQIQDGYEYLGGDPAQPESWRKIQ